MRGILMNFLVTTSEDEKFDTGSLADESLDGAGLSLREAVALAATTNGPDTIRFDAAVTTIDLTDIFLTIDSDVIINGDRDGDGVADVTVTSAWESLPVMRVAEGTNVVLESLILTGGTGRLAGGVPGREGARGASGFQDNENDGRATGGNGGSGTDGSGIGRFARGGDGGNGGNAVIEFLDFDFSATGFGGNGGNGGDGGIGADGGAGGKGGSVFDFSSSSFIPREVEGGGGVGGNGGFGGGRGGDAGVSGFPGADDFFFEEFLSSNPGNGGDAVGGIWNQGTLTLRRVEIYGTQAFGGDAGNFTEGDLGFFTADGFVPGQGGDAAGGIWADPGSVLFIEDSAFSETGTGVRPGNTVAGGLNTRSIEFPGRDPDSFGSAFGVTNGALSGGTALVGNTEATDQVSAPGNQPITDQIAYLYAAPALTAVEGGVLTAFVHRLGDISSAIDVSLHQAGMDFAHSSFNHLAVVHGSVGGTEFSVTAPLH
ncbi:MAG: hypothetical protein AB8B85_23945, partial [Paracoccaceae bacterium]